MATIAEAFEAALNYERAGRLRDAEYICEQIVQYEPAHGDALHLLGTIAHRDGKSERAIELLRRAIEINPQSAALHADLGSLYRRSGRLEEAAASLEQACLLQPDSYLAHVNLGDVFNAMGKVDEAITRYQQALQLRPPDALASFHLATYCWQHKRVDAAEANYRDAIRIKPDFPEALNNLGIVVQLQAVCKGIPRLLDEAIDLFQRSVAIHPEEVGTHWNLARALLLAGRLEQGWREFEWRVYHRPLGIWRDFAEPMWDGSNLTGRTLLLYTEGGFGDALHFIRYAPMVAGRGGQVILECQPELKTLLASVPGLDRIVVRGEALPRFDVRLPLQSLPLIFGTTLENIPADVPYLKVDGARLVCWQRKLAASEKQTVESQTPSCSGPSLTIHGPRPAAHCLKVGLVWAGRPKSGKDIYNDTVIPLEKFAPLAQVKGVTFYSLQKGEAANEIQHAPAALKLVDWTSELTDFSETAALVSQLDLVISVDTSMVHLAGALGKPIWVLLPVLPDFRWLLEREDSPWYPTMRLFRQKTVGDWDGVMQRVTEELARYSCRP